MGELECAYSTERKREMQLHKHTYIQIQRIFDFGYTTATPLETLTFSVQLK
uniref:Uncharacterized protein n=1 Tax=Rhizophora mucronata TaxID=61149 RepID=A0A2P2NX80_RHIMU